MRGSVSSTLRCGTHNATPDGPPPPRAARVLAWGVGGAQGTLRHYLTHRYARPRCGAAADPNGGVLRSPWDAAYGDNARWSHAQASSGDSKKRTVPCQVLSRSKVPNGATTSAPSRPAP
jgi:hypothetical protein